MTPEQLATRCVWVAMQLRIEADRWLGTKRDHLRAGASMLVAASRLAVTNPPLAAQYLTEGIAELTTAATTRALVQLNTDRIVWPAAPIKEIPHG